MSRAHRFAIVPLALAASLSLGCGGAFTRAAGKYGDATKESAAALAGAPAMVTELCRKEAELSYLYGRLRNAGRIEPWTQFSKKTQAAHGAKGTWESHCAQYEASGKLFAHGVEVIQAYGAALAALAEKGQYDGADFEALGTDAANIAKSLGNEEAGKKIQPAGSAVKLLGSFLFGAVTERRIEGYVKDGAPKIKAVLGPLEAYVRAVEATWLPAENGLSAQVIDMAEAGILTQGPEAAKWLAFYQLASGLDADARRTRAALTGYGRVLEEMGAAHDKLPAAAESGKDEEIKKALGAVLDVMKQLQALKSALANKE